MTTNIKARYTNGALVPLEPLDLEEGAVVSVSVEKTGNVSNPAGAEAQKEKEPFKVVPLASGFAPGVTPENLKDVLYEMDVEEYLEKERSSRERDR